MPAINYSSSGLSLWRRLILGEGDGRDTRTTAPSGVSGTGLGTSTGVGVGTGAGYYSNTKEGIGYSPSQLGVDIDSPYLAYEEEARRDDEMRPAVKLAVALRRAHFPYVSVLEGSLPALVRQLMSSRGSVEPVMINHDHDQWLHYLRNHDLLDTTGVTATTASGTTDTSKQQQQQSFLPLQAFFRLSSSSSSSAHGPRPAADNGDNDSSAYSESDDDGASDTESSSFIDTSASTSIVGMNTKLLSLQGLVNTDMLSYDYLSQPAAAVTAGTHQSASGNDPVESNALNAPLSLTSVSHIHSSSLNIKTPKTKIKYSRNLSKQDKYVIAHRTAKELGHGQVEQILLDKLDQV